MPLLDPVSSTDTEDTFPALPGRCLELCAELLGTPRLVDLDFFAAPPPLRMSRGLSLFLRPLLGSLGLPADMLFGDCVESKSFDCTLVENRTESSSEPSGRGTECSEDCGAGAPRPGGAWLEIVEKALERASFLEIEESDTENSELLPKDFASSLR